MHRTPLIKVYLFHFPDENFSSKRGNGKLHRRRSSSCSSESNSSTETCASREQFIPMYGRDAGIELECREPVSKIHKVIAPLLLLNSTPFYCKSEFQCVWRFLSNYSTLPAKFQYVSVSLGDTDLANISVQRVASGTRG